MLTDSKFFIEVDCCRCSEHGQIVSGDVYLQRKADNRIILVLADGDGTGVKANTIAGVIASMAVNYTMMEEDVAHAAEVIIRTFNGDGKDNHAAFTIVDIHRGGEVKIVEYGNPRIAVLREGEELPVDRTTVNVSSGHLNIASFKAESEDRIVLVSDGVIASGFGTKRLPHGWGRASMIEFTRRAVAADAEISAHLLAQRIFSQAEINDLFVPKNDMSCVAVYFRHPRSILICTGPPFKESRDAMLSEMIANYKGTILICGGTTAQIVSRELGREISVSLKRDPSGLPPTSTMDGVELITEGVLTLTKVKTLLEKIEGSDVEAKGTDGNVARMLLSHDIIEFVVGTGINPLHQDPSLPVELELRRNLIKSLAALLETKFMKEVKIKYI